MALINCPNCGKEVSNRAASCPSCGYDLSVLHESEDKSAPIITCEDCGAEIPSSAEVCPNCGCPTMQESEPEAPQKVEVTKVNLPKIKNRKTAIIAISVVAVIIVGLFVGMKIHREKVSIKYGESIETVSAKMIAGSAIAEDACNLTRSVWNNTIFEKYDSSTNKYTRKNNGTGGFYDDFNDAISALYADSDFSAKISSIEVNQTEVAETMKTLTNPPEEYAEEYEALKKFYDAYLDLTNLATNPTGNLQTYSSNFSDADSNALNCYNKVKLYFKNNLPG